MNSFLKPNIWLKYLLPNQYALHSKVKEQELPDGCLASGIDKLMSKD